MWEKNVLIICSCNHNLCKNNKICWFYCLQEFSKNASRGMFFPTTLWMVENIWNIPWKSLFETLIWFAFWRRLYFDSKVRYQSIIMYLSCIFIACKHSQICKHLNLYVVQSPGFKSCSRLWPRPPLILLLRSYLCLCMSLDAHSEGVTNMWISL